MSPLRTVLAGAVLLIAIAGCAGSSGVSGSPAPSAHVQSGITGIVTSGPVCPVERVPPDPSCAPRPVGGATLIVRDGTGHEVARATSEADGRFLIPVAPGTYVVEPQPVTGLMGTAPPQDVTVDPGSLATIEVSYDTGIR